ncbi:hypothetical protein ACFWBX_09015 [Streptomyces sp. NPDC059991]|uniref:hypothetical protein n=1 Tax=Streptomyces sp. NPDC059991 TaxID=3347028 RepID=UPI00369CE6F8
MEEPGAECEGCRERRVKRRTHRAKLRQVFGRQGTAALIRSRTVGADRLAARYRRWQALGSEPLPAGTNHLERLRYALDEVSVIDAELNRRYMAGVRPLAAAGPLPVEKAFRRRLLASLRSGGRSVADVLEPAGDLGDPATAAMLDATHAFAIVAAQAGHRRAEASFRRSDLALAGSWEELRGFVPSVIEALTSSREGADEPDLPNVVRLDSELTSRSRTVEVKVIGDR